MLLGAHSVGVLDRAAEVEHAKHGEDHHHALEQQGELKLLPYPAGREQKQSPSDRGQIELLYERTYSMESKNTV